MQITRKTIVIIISVSVLTSLSILTYRNATLVKSIPVLLPKDDLYKRVIKKSTMLLENLGWGIVGGLS
jgi:SepF-like predicted cell division protein (DUF552 family)